MDALGFVIGREPREPFVESIACRSAGRLNVPISISDPGQAELLLDLVWFHCVRQVLLIGEDQNDGVPHFTVVDDAMQLLPGLIYAISIRTVHYKDQSLGAGVVVPPKRTDLVLTTDVPNVELDVLVGDGLHVEADRGNGGNGLSQFEFVQDGRLAGSVKSKHQYSHLLVAKDLGKHLPHLVGCAYITFVAKKKITGVSGLVSLTRNKRLDFERWSQNIAAKFTSQIEPSLLFRL